LKTVSLPLCAFPEDDRITPRPRITILIHTDSYESAISTMTRKY